MDDLFPEFDQPISTMEDIQRTLRDLRLLRPEALAVVFEKYLSERPATTKRKPQEMAVAYTLMMKNAANLWDDDKEPQKHRMAREAALAACRIADPVVKKGPVKKEKKVTTAATTEKKVVLTEVKPAPNREKIIISKEALQVLEKVEEAKEVKPKKPKAAPDALALKLKGMDLAAAVKWAKELKVEKVEEMAKRNPALAKMQVGNGIRSALKAKEATKK